MAFEGVQHLPGRYVHESDVRIQGRDEICLAVQRRHHGGYRRFEGVRWQMAYRNGTLTPNKVCPQLAHTQVVRADVAVDGSGHYYAVSDPQGLNGILGFFENLYRLAVLRPSVRIVRKQSLATVREKDLPEIPQSHGRVI